MYILENIGRSDMIHGIPLPHLYKYDLMGKHILALFFNFIVYTFLHLMFEYRDVLMKWKR